jgi:hypothetical protein
LAIKHRTAVIQGNNHLITFDGVTLTHSRPCNYILAHDMQGNDFTVMQTYKKSPRNGQPLRDQLRVQFGNVRVSISREGVFKVNDEAQTLPIEKDISGKTIEAKRENRIIEALFHAELKNILVVRCSTVTDSCVIKVHPLYHGKLSGLAGSNDGRKENDIQGDSSESHMRFWTAGECMESGSSAIEPVSTEDDQCQRWFGQSASVFDKCFSTVQPEPFLIMCRQYKRSNKNTCQVATLYIERCRSELVNINTPRECVQCRLNSGKEIKQQDVVSDMTELKKLTQVVFVIENSQCVKEKLGSSERASSVDYLAQLINRIPAKDSEQVVQFGLATIGSNGEKRGIHALPISESSETFGTYFDLKSALTSFLASRSEEVQEFDALKGIAQLNEQFEWEPLAQKHVIVIACQPCSARSWDYAATFDKAFNTIKNQIYLHVINAGSVPSPSGENDWKRNMVGYDSTKAFFSDRRPETVARLSSLNPSSHCLSELALDSQTQSKGSVWSLSEFVQNTSETEAPTPSAKMSRQLAMQVIKPLHEKPQCLRCDCALSELMVARPRCRIAACAK